ncbi:MAG TPA: response regulator [Candidatus Lokiarchaeia archaeon]|nr:response regulator [Candidatus Lokiarchaeia archaeon]
MKAKARSRKKILVVDDEPDIRMILRMVLEKHDYQVVEAGNGRKAMEVLEHDNKEISCVITDYLMPELDGLQLCKQLRQKFNHMMSVFLITAYLDQEQFDGATCFDEKFMKPLNFEDLITKLKTHAVA